MSDAKARETSLWTWLREGCRGKFDGLLYMERIENAVSSGHPDVDGCLDCHGFKLELKTAARPSRRTTNVAVHFTKAQVPWHRRYLPCGGRAYVLIQVGSAHAARRYLVPGRLAAAVKDGMTEDELDLASLVDPESDAVAIVAHAAVKPAWY